MKVFFNYSLLNSVLKKNQTIGLVPTMGTLHKGHISLIEKALKENAQIIVSIFINPTQFGNLSEIKKYPKNLDNDLNIIEKISSKIYVYAPEPKDLYKTSVSSSSFEFGNIENIMEGQLKPGHFQGVATIIEKLFNNFLPTNAYFGEKDFQQLQIIKTLVNQKKILTKIIDCPIVREKNGLALSSRNTLLSIDDKQKASFIFQQLLRAKLLWKSKNSEKIIKEIKQSFLSNSNLKLEYIDIRYEDSLKSAQKKSFKKARAFIAAKIANVRLIDNLALDEF